MATKRTSRRGQIQDGVLAQIRAGLMAGAFVPGRTMSLRELAALYGTSPMPVREALSHLVAANALELLPSRQVRVPRLTGERFRELASVREKLEAMATEAACRRATPQLVDGLARINARLGKAIADRDVARCLALNQQFHFALYEAAQSQVLMPLIESLWLQCGPTMYLSLLDPATPWDASAHAALVEALADGNVQQARAAILEDIRTTARVILRRAGSASGPAAGFLNPLAS